MTNYIEAINNTIKIDYNDYYKLIDSINDTYKIKLLKLNIILNIITDFKLYCYIESEYEILKEQIDNFNITMIFSNKSPINIISNIHKVIKSNNELVLYDNDDSFHIFKKMNNTLEFSKIKIDYMEIKKQLLSYYNNPYNKICNFNIPKELLLNNNQIVKLLINEIIIINQNREYEHTINILNKEDPFKLNVNLFLQKSQCKMIEFQLNINPTLYPFYPPEIKYIKPSISPELLLNLLNLDILKIHNWSSSITLEYLITKLSEQLELVIDEHINKIISKSNNSLFNNYDFELNNICHKTVTNIINIPIPKKITSKTSGIGYSTDKSSDWDIKKYIKSIELENNKINKCLANIYELIINDKVLQNEIRDSYLLKYIINEIRSINLLEIEKKSDIYDYIFKILNKLDKSLIICDLKQLDEEIETYKLTSPINDKLLLIQSVCKKFNKDEIIKVDTTNYETIMKKYIFNMYTLPDTHLFYKERINKLNKDTIKRISTEIGSLKNGLPINYDSTIWVRVSKENINLITFLISGPKDTPYENGLFEFHGYLPDTYPNIVPKVLIKTTGGGKFRFNPNLYACGKVCLSLLNTWRGMTGEEWNPETSTFLQIMVSIQSLILVDKPYFNEPGYAHEIDTPSGNKKSLEYNKNIYPNTIKYAMIDMIKNPPVGFEDIIKNHFKLKRDDINKTLIRWEQKELLDDLNKLINDL